MEALPFHRQAGTKDKATGFEILLGRRSDPPVFSIPELRLK
jgi:hypothetical protein